MFSTSELDYIKGLTEKEYSNGNKYYVCITNNPTGTGTTTNNIYDIICYYSKNEIIENTNNFIIPNESKKCSLDSNNYSTSNTIDKLECVSYNGNVTKNTKEYVYSNIGEYANIIQEYEESHNFEYNFFIVGLLIMSIILIYNFVKNIIN